MTHKARHIVRMVDKLGEKTSIIIFIAGKMLSRSLKKKEMQISSSVLLLSGMLNFNEVDK